MLNVFCRSTTERILNFIETNIIQNHFKLSSFVNPFEYCVIYVHDSECAQISKLSNRILTALLDTL